MGKKMIITLFLMIACFMASPVNTQAFELSGISSHTVYQLQSNGVTSTEDMQDWLDDYNQEQSCTGDNSILGNVNDEKSVAWLLQQIFNFIKVIGPTLVVVLSSIDFAKVIIKSDDDAMEKAKRKLITRLILAALLFFIPTLVQVLLDVFGFTSDTTCGLQ